MTDSKMTHLNYENTYRVSLLRALFLSLILLFSTQTPLTAARRNPQRADYVCFGLSGGYSTMLGHTPNMIVPGSGAAGVLAGYEFRENSLLIRLTGEFQLFNSRCQSNITVGDILFHDTRLADATMHYQMLSPLRERQMLGFTNLGVMAGYTASTFGKANNASAGFYLLGGFKIGGQFDLMSSAQLEYATSATFNQYIDDYKDAPNHFYTEWEKLDTVKFNSKLNFMFAFELGWDISLKYCNKLKVGLFADVGMINQTSKTSTAVCEPNPDNVADLILASYYQNPDMKNKYVIPFIAGLRVVFSVNCTKKKGCSSCKCYK